MPNGVSQDFLPVDQVDDAHRKGDSERHGSRGSIPEPGDVSTLALSPRGPRRKRPDAEAFREVPPAPGTSQAPRQGAGNAQRRRSGTIARRRITARPSATGKASAFAGPTGCERALCQQLRPIVCVFYNVSFICGPMPAAIEKCRECDGTDTYCSRMNPMMNPKM